MRNYLRDAARLALRGLQSASAFIANARRSGLPCCEQYSSSDLLVAREIARRLQAGDDVLDIGCGDGHRLDAIQLFKDIGKSGVDLAPPPSSPEIHLRAFDGSHLPFRQQTFDVSLICYVLHHLAPEQAVRILHEAMRVTRRKIIILEDSMPAFDVFYRLRNTFHRIESDLAYSSAPAYRPTRNDDMFLTYREWRAFLAQFARAKEEKLVSLQHITKYAHHTLIELELQPA